ncbi:L,D-transpeptidase [Acetobacter farinalis]|uniref:L,D-transpeptidase n=1 Tax=Acetobacter farinalis TaxID=1260984 RepID=A0ABT3Q3V8_9PROT|nr:L,D-transpeptidase [Acetobacter farinalis]MCX2559963.1 L,D-transpeptidase [Acetobacter farinalis]NHO28623.1 L,D-transpeptidase [Acetobacter farinalis]
MSGARCPTLLFIAGSLFLVPGLAQAAGVPPSPRAGQEGGQPAQADQEGAPSPALSPAEPVLKEAPPLPDLPVLNEAEARAEATRLNSAFRHEVPVALKVSATQKAAWITLAQEQIHQASFRLDRPQVLLVVDRNPAVQRMCLMLALPGRSDWQVIGSTKVSTGTTGRKFYYITPTGVFTNTADILGYRALGTKNENGIMGNGTKGMRVWDFGWQWAEKGWLPSREKGQIRLEMHATDPVYLESRLGHVASEGCIRIPSSLNVFIDKHGLIDAEYEQMAVIDDRFRALLRPDRVASRLAGSAVVVVDSANRPDLAHVTITENKTTTRRTAQTHS